MPSKVCFGVSGKRVHAELGLPVELHERGLAFGVDQPEGVDAEALHHPVGPGYRAVGHLPHDVVGRLGVRGDEVPERVVRALRLRDLAVRMWLGGVDDVRELDPVLDEEHRDVVADEVERALLGVELRGEPTRVAHGVGRPPRPDDGREPDEHRGFDAPAEELGHAHLRRGAVADEDAVRAVAPRVHDPLRDAFVVEVRDLLAQVVVLQQGRAALPRLERVVGVVEPGAL
jgi:hypothetical protein